MNDKSLSVLPVAPGVLNPYVTLLPNRENRRYRILVVDDESTIRNHYAEILTEIGYQVDMAEDGAMAWDILQEGYYDLVVTDNKMPKVTGMELLGKIQDARRKVPVILATGSLPMDTDGSRPLPKPVAALVKPFTDELLLETVSRVLRGESWGLSKTEHCSDGDGFNLNLIR